MSENGNPAVLLNAEQASRLALGEGARIDESLATALGAALGGLRATAELDGSAILGSLAELRGAVERRVPLVVHLAERSSAKALGPGHDAFHAAAASMPLALFAANVQEAADLAVIARRTAEQALLPALVGWDVPQDSLQDVKLPSPDDVAAYLGRPGDTIHPPTPEQQVLFGEHRRRLPRWHDLERPALSGALLGREAYALASAARAVFAGHHIPQILDEAFGSFRLRVGRSYAPFSTHRTESARLILIAQGTAVETLNAVADRLRDERVRAGVIGVRCLRPFPAEELARLAGRARGVVVFERTTPGDPVDAPLSRQVRAALNLVPGAKAPVATIFYGLGGHPLRAGDVGAVVRELHAAAKRSLGSGAPWRSPRILGMDFSARGTEYPKRRALADSLMRDYPAAADLGSRADEPLDVRPRGALTLVVARPAGKAAAFFMTDAARLLHRTGGGQVRSQAGRLWQRWGATTLDRLTHLPRSGQEPLYDPGDDAPADVAVWWDENLASPAALAGELRAGGALVLERPPVAGEPLPVDGQGYEYFALPANMPASAGGMAARSERLLGALFGSLRILGKLSLAPKRLFGIRRTMLGETGLEEDDVERCMAAFEAGFSQVGRYSPAVAEHVATHGGDNVPGAVRGAVRRHAVPGDHPANLARFWDQVGVVYRENPGRPAEILPDPNLATLILPPASSALIAATAARTRMPAFDPLPCTGCGDCWSVCPEGAISPIVLGARPLLEKAMELTGGNASALRPVVGRIATALDRVLQEKTDDGSVQGGLAAELLDRAVDAVLRKTPADRQAALTDSWEAVRATLCDLLVARTAIFFDEPDADVQGSGELLSLVIDPDSCKGCALCAAACEAGALSPRPLDEARRRAARQLRDLAEALPEPSATTVAHARRHPEAGPLAGAMLGRRHREILVGGDGAEAGSGEKIAVRQVLGSASFHLEPVRQGLLDEIGELRAALAKTIRSHLADALPDDDLDALAAGLEALRKPEAELAELTSRIEGSFDSQNVDVARLRQLVQVAREVADLDFRATPSAQRSGWAPFSVLVTGEATAWAAAFPANPFTVPVVAAPRVGMPGGDGFAKLARGLVEGSIALTLDALHTLRRARALVDGQRLEGVRAPAWEELTADERRLCPPLFVLSPRGATESLSAQAETEEFGIAVPCLTRDLPCGERDVLLPIKLVFLDSGGSKVRATGPHGGVLAETAVARSTIVYRSSIAHADRLDAAVAAMLSHDGPARLDVLAPSPERAGRPTDAALDLAREAVADGRFNLEDAAAPPVAEEAPAAVASISDDELARLRAEHETALVAAREEAEREIADRLRVRLRALAHAPTIPADERP